MNITISELIQKVIDEQIPCWGENENQFECKILNFDKEMKVLCISHSPESIGYIPLNSIKNFRVEMDNEQIEKVTIALHPDRLTSRNVTNAIETTIQEHILPGFSNIIEAINKN